MNPVFFLEPTLRLAAERLGWTLLHSLWQGALIVAVLAVALGLLRTRSAAARHHACLLALLALAAAAGFTLARETHRTGLPRAPLAAPSSTDLENARSAGGNEPPQAALPPTSARTLRPSGHAQIAPSPVLARVPAALLGGLHRSSPWLSALWVAGVLALSLRRAAGWHRVRALRSQGGPVRGAPQEALQGLCARYGLRVGAVRLLETAEDAVPMLLGLWRPAVLLPARAVTGLSAAQLEAILAHELAHLVRRDPWSNLALVALETLFFYHPAVWWLGRRVREERELAADDLALEICANRRLYAGALARLAEFQHVPAFALAGTGTGDRGSLVYRIRRLLQPPLPTSSAGPTAWALALPPALAAAALGLVWLADAQPSASFRADLPSATASPASASSPAPAASPAPFVPTVSTQDVEDVRVARLLAVNRHAARVRAASDRAIYTPEQLQEIETFYQVANTKGLHNAQSRRSLKELLARYDKADRTGCATLYYGQGSTGAERLEYLTRAVEQYSDCYYFNGCQVGGYGRYVLALTLLENGQKDKARTLLDEIKTTYKEATGHDGRPLVEAVAEVEKDLVAHP